MEDLRIMIGQNIGLCYLMPLAIKVLEENILAEGDFYGGDLLKSVLTSDVKYWINTEESWNRIIDIVNSNEEKIDSLNMSNKIDKALIDAFKEFESLITLQKHRK